jgi:hypothetical protein
MGQLGILLNGPKLGVGLREFFHGVLDFVVNAGCITKTITRCGGGVYPSCASRVFYCRRQS